MPRGIPNAKTAGQPMTSEDMALVEQRIEGKRAPLHEDDHPLPKARVMKTEDGREIKQVGNFANTLNYGDSQTLRKFARIEPSYEGWIKMSNQQALIYQDLRLLIGHDGDKKLGLIDSKKLSRIKQDGKNGLLSEKDMEFLQQLEDSK